MPSRTILPLAAALLLALALPAHADGGGGGGIGLTAPNSADPDFRAGEAAAKQEHWSDVITHMGAVVQREPDNADAWNWMGYAYRHLGQMDKSFQHYEQALKLNPGHRGAHEYMGEAYLQVGQLDKAEEHLKALDKLCLFPCEQFSELKEKIEDYKRTHSPQ